MLPQLLAVWLLSVVGGVLAFIGWFAALALGRLPRWIAVFELNLIAYSLRVNAYAFLLVDAYPPFSFSPADYPIVVQIGASRLSRLKVFFRWLLAIPVYIVSGIAGQGLLLPQPGHLAHHARPRPDAAAPIQRGSGGDPLPGPAVRVHGSRSTDDYPRQLFGDPEWERESEEPGRDLSAAAF